MVDAPVRIRVAQDGDGFWTCREAVTGSPEYVRADLFAQLKAENERLTKERDEAQIAHVRLCDALGIQATALSHLDAESLSRTGAVKVGPLAHVVAEMLERAGEARPNGDILHDILAQALPAALGPAAPEGQQPVAVEALAEFLCSEFDFDLDPITGASWPEHENDDGYRGNGYVRLQPSDVQARARENAARILTFIGQKAARPSEQAVTEAMVERTFKDGVRYASVCDVDDVDEAWRTSAGRAVLEPAAPEWRPIKSAPKDASLILYANKFGEIGYCYWSKAVGVFDQSMWWDDQADDECCPVVWLPADTLPPLKAAMEAGRHE